MASIKIILDQSGQTCKFCTVFCFHVANYTLFGEGGKR